MEIYQAVGQNIHRIRKAQQLSIDRAAALSGVSKSMLGQIERGLVNPTVSVLARIAGGLHVPIEQLVECREETPAQLHRAGRRRRRAALRREGHPLSALPL